VPDPSNVPTSGAPARVFADRHIGPTPAETAEMLKTVGYGSTAELMTAALCPGDR
jgi:glycine dehydrogenase